MNRRKLIYIVTSGWLLLLLLLLLFINQKFSLVSATREHDTVQLSIALVNEDRGVISDNKFYQLGSDYVKKIEKETTHDWYTVTRGIGENGLKKGTYQLLVIIPSNFSEKLLDLKNPSPEKIQLNYKVNGNGNDRLETEAKKVGRQAVSDLSRELVDMYVVSILDNLFTAQKNIEKVYGNEKEVQAAFERTMYLPAVQMNQNLPSLLTQTAEVQKNNTQITDQLSFFTKTGDNQEEYSTQLETFLQQRSEGKLAYEELVKHLISVDSSLLSEETSELFSSIRESTQVFSDHLGTEGEQSFQQAVNLSSEITRAKQLIEDQTEQLDELQDKFFDRYKNQFYQLFGYKQAEQTESDQVITLRDVLNKRNEMHLDPEEDESAAFLDEVDSFNQRRIEQLQKNLELLPARNTAENSEFLKIFQAADLPCLNSIGQKNNFLSEITPYLTDIETNVNLINQKIEAHNAQYVGSPDKATAFQSLPLLNWSDDNSTVLQHSANYYGSLNSAYSLLQKEANKINEKDFSFDVHLENIGQEARLKLTLPKNAAAETVSVKGEGCTVLSSSEMEHIYEIEAFPGKRTYTVIYQLKEMLEEESSLNEFVVKVSQRAVAEQESVLEISPAVGMAPKKYDFQTPEIIEVTENTNDTGIVSSDNVQDNYTLIWHVPVNSSSFYTEEFLTAKRVYLEELGKIKELYKQVVDNLKAFEKEELLNSHSLLTMDVTAFFSSVINELFMSSGGDFERQEKQLQKLLEEVDFIEGRNAGTMLLLEELQQNAERLNAEVGMQLQTLENIQIAAQTAVLESNQQLSIYEKNDQELVKIGESFRQLLLQSQEMRDRSDQIIQKTTEAENMSGLFTENIQAVLKNSMNLTLEVDDFLKTMSETLTDNSKFFEEFSNVLNHTYPEGIPNNALLEFISEPVKEKLETVIPTAINSPPFTWILIMFTVSLFLSCLFVTQPSAAYPQTMLKQIWVRANLFKIVFLCLSASVIGFVFASLSISELQLLKELQFVWGAVIVLFMVLFTLMNHYLLKQFHIAGFALSLFILISYIFTSVSVGDVKPESFAVKLLQQGNPLVIGQDYLTEIVSAHSLDSRKLAVCLFVLVEFILFNLFIWKPFGKGKAESR